MRSVKLVLVLLVSACASFTLGSSEPLRVLVYNIHAGKDARGADNLERVARIVRDARADIVLLQEVDRRTTRSGNVDQVERLRSLTGFNAAFGKTLDYQGGQYGIALFTRWPIVTDTLIHLPVEPPQHRSGVSYEPRGALRVAVDAPSGRIHVLNTHIDASREDTYRRQEARTVLALADSLRRISGLVLIGGDLNSEPESAVLEMFSMAGWRDAWKQCGRGNGPSYPADVPVKRIDYLLISGETRCSGARVIDTRVSDHRPVLFEIRPAPRRDREPQQFASLIRP